MNQAGPERCKDLRSELARRMESCLIGTYSRVVFPDIENPEFVSSLLAFEVMPYFAASLFLVAVLAAIISTTDSYLHILAVIVVRDLFRSLFAPEMESPRN